MIILQLLLASLFDPFFFLSNFSSHPGAFLFASPPEDVRGGWRDFPPALTSPVESAQRHLEYFCIGLAGSISDAVRRNWLALEEKRPIAQDFLVGCFHGTRIYFLVRHLISLRVAKVVEY